MKRKPKLLDLFSGAGGCAVGFDVVGVDISPQPHYPFRHVVADALEYALEHGREYDVIHASPPCQRYSVARQSDNHPDLVPPTRETLLAVAKPYVIENVMGAPLGVSCVLCGSMFGLLVQRHRVFECSYLLLSPGPCRHGVFVGSYPCGRSAGTNRAGERSKVVHVYGHGGSRGDRDLWARAMGIDWMTMREMGQAIPPAYTEFIGRQLLRALENPSP